MIWFDFDARRHPWFIPDFAIPKFRIFFYGIQHLTSGVWELGKAARTAEIDHRRIYSLRLIVTVFVVVVRYTKCGSGVLYSSTLEPSNKFQCQDLLIHWLPLSPVCCLKHGSKIYRVDLRSSFPLEPIFTEFCTFLYLTQQVEEDDRAQ
jgi:hypothetical protein